MSITYTPLEVKDIEATVKSEGLDQMMGRPSPGSLINIINQLYRAFQTVHSPYYAYGMLYIVLPPRFYTVITGETVDPPADPGAIPPYLHGGYASTNHVILLTWKTRKRPIKIIYAATKWPSPKQNGPSQPTSKPHSPNSSWAIPIEFLFYSSTVCIKNKDTTLPTTPRPTVQELR